MAGSSIDGIPHSSSAKYRKNEGWCSKSLLRNYLYIFNFFFLIGGGVVLAVGIWSILTEHEFITLLSGVSYSITSYLLVVAGIVVIVATFIGCLGICRKDRCFLLVYILMLLLVFLLEAKAGILAFIYREQAYNDLQVHLNETFSKDYGFDETKTSAINNLHQEFRCCGALSHRDWHTSSWKTFGLSGENKVPDSCCITVTDACGVREHPSRIFPTGCIHKLKVLVKNQLGYLAIAGLGLCILQVFGIIFSTCLYIKLKSPDISDI